MRHRSLVTATLATALLAIPAIPVFADSMGGWMDMSGQMDLESGPTCTVSFKPVSATEVESCYEGNINGKPGKNCARISSAVNVEAVAFALQDGRDCARVIIRHS